MASLINFNTPPVQPNRTPPTAKPEGATEAAPYDEFAPLRTEPDIHSLGEYGKNIADSAGLGFAGGFIQASKPVEELMPSYDGQKHFGKHLLAAIPPLVAGVVGGIAGAGVGLALALVGKNIGTHMSEHTLQS